jgi:acid phosphatase class B
VTAPTLGKRKKFVASFNQVDFVGTNFSDKNTKNSDVADERVRIFTGKNENELAEAAEGDFLVFLSEIGD